MEHIKIEIDKEKLRQQTIRRMVQLIRQFGQNGVKIAFTPGTEPAALLRDGEIRRTVAEYDTLIGLIEKLDGTGRAEDSCMDKKSPLELVSFLIHQTVACYSYDEEEQVGRMLAVWHLAIPALHRKLEPEGGGDAADV